MTDTFESRHPSLKGKTIRNNKGAVDWVLNGDYVRKDDVDVSQLDKKIVREAIDKCLPDHKTLICMGDCPICRFKKELGLEE